jgi:hypothetical protein
MALGIDIAEGVQVIPDIKAERHGKVLVMDFESDKATQRRRYMSLIKGAGGVAGKNMRYERMSGSLPAQIDTVTRWMSEEEYVLGIVDSLSWAAGGSLNDDDVATTFFTAIRQLPCALLLIAHVRKNNENGKPFGSAFWWNGARNVYELRLDQEPGSRSSMIAMHHVKGNDLFLMEPMAWAAHTRDGMTYYERQAMIESDKFKTDLPYWKLAVSILSGHGRDMLQSELVSAIRDEKGTSVGTRTITKSLERKRDMLTKEGDMWWLTQTGIEYGRDMSGTSVGHVPTSLEGTHALSPKGEGYVPPSGGLKNQKEITEEINW